MENKKIWKILMWVVIGLLILFLLYYFLKPKNTEKCPDGSDIPASGDCADNIKKNPITGQVVTPPPTNPDMNGCIQPSKYITNAFPLALGMRGGLVKMLQSRLNTDFNAKIAEDGFLGCHTIAAMKAAWNIDTMTMQFFNDNVQGTVSTPIST